MISKIGGLVAAATVATFGMFGSAKAAVMNFSETSSGINLSAQVTLTFNSIVSGEYLYDVTVANTTLPQAGDNSLVAFAFNVDPDNVQIGSINTSSIFSFAGGSGNVGQGLGSFEFCYEVDNNNNCTGNNPSNALGEGESDSFQLSFISPSQLVFLNGLVRFQEVGANGGSEKIGSGDCDPITQICGPPVSQIPVPASLPLMISALGVGVLINRRRRKLA
ncbi:cistern family PEP-CTERM protein [Sedimentitalea sp. HM32M-2]|uniref:cistern family PEP-CTERM protein n=1 Tax=Sedimentitalea sp. HM32M-2 TaxID=3351566 RepID=UPI0036440481